MTATVAASKPGPRASASAPPGRVAVGPDNEANQRVILRLLDKVGLSVQLLNSWQLAVAAAAREQFELILMEVQKPDIDGFEATAAIRWWEAVDGTHTRILALTAHTMAGDRDRCLEYGMGGFLQKLIILRDLHAAPARLGPSVQSSLADSAAGSETAA